MLYWSSILVSLGLFFGYVWIDSLTKNSMLIGGHKILEELIYNANPILALVVGITVCLQFSYIWHNYVIFVDVMNAWQMMKLLFKQHKGPLLPLAHLTLTSEKFITMDNSKLLEMIKYRSNYLSKVVKKVYKNSPHLESFMLESNSPTSLLSSHLLLH